MTLKTPCPRCGFPLTPHHRGRHMNVCKNMPLPEEMAEVAKTMTIAEIAREWGASPSTVAHRLRYLGIKAKRYQKNKPLTDLQREPIVKLYNGNVAIRKIAVMLGVNEEMVYPEVPLLIAAGRMEKREQPQGAVLNVPRCSKCKIWLDGRDVPKGDGGRCGFCCGEVPALEVVTPTAVVLYASVVWQALRDSRSKNGHRAAAREWFASDDSEPWLDAVGANIDAAREQIVREAVA